MTIRAATPLLALASLACVGFLVAGQQPEKPVTVSPVFPFAFTFPFPIPVPAAPDSATRTDLEWVKHQVRTYRPTSNTPVNGVKMEVDVRVFNRDTEADIDFGWALTYSGPRPPLTIIEPSLTKETSGQTWVEISAFAKGNEKGRITSIRSPFPKQPPAFLPFEAISKRGLFVTVEKGKSVRGTVSVSAQQLKKQLLDLAPKEFDAQGPPVLFAQFFHSPLSRGGSDNLDAWTGELRSQMLEVPAVKAW